jgi:hypothetical protein
LPFFLIRQRQRVYPGISAKDVHRKTNAVEGINKKRRKNEMINESEFDYVDMTDEELAAQAFNDAVEHAQITLQLSENCYRKFGKQLLSETQKSYFQNMANGILPTDEEQTAMDNEQITLDMQAVKKAREINKQQAAKLGEAYTPELRLEDKTEGFGVN